MEKTLKEKYSCRLNIPSIALCGILQIFICFVTLIVQYLFVSFTKPSNYIKFTEIHAETLIGTLILRLSLGASFAISGCFGIWASHKQSITSICTSLIAASVSACLCIVYLVESAMCMMHMIAEIEINSSKSQAPVSEDILNIDVQLGEGSPFKDTELEDQSLKLRLTLFTVQLIACLMQAVVVMVFCSKLNQRMKRKESPKYHQFVSKEAKIVC